MNIFLFEEVLAVRNPTFLMHPGNNSQGLREFAAPPPREIKGCLWEGGGMGPPMRAVLIASIYIRTL